MVKKNRKQGGPLFSDGLSAEDHMLAAIRSVGDVSLESEELLGKVRDIPSYYHFGAGRSAILRCLDLPPDSRVLELGAGCGAITRTLGETFASVCAVERNATRAEIARERCRDLENVTVVCEDLGKAAFQPDYDIVVIVGVLEHAPVYIYPEEDSRNACLKLLNLGESALGKNGRLVLAIENRIGLDYWAGAPENHTGRSYDGIHEYPNVGSQITFTKPELEKLLNDAGFPHTAFYFCFPDYSFTRTIFSSIGNESELFLHNWVDFPLDSPANPKKPTFNKPLAAKALSRSGILREFANAFLVVASKEDIPTPNWVAKKYNIARKEPFRNVTTLFLNPEPYVQKTSLRLDRSDTGDFRNSRLKHEMGSASWHAGDLLTLKIEKAALSQNFPNQVTFLIRRYNHELMSNFGTGLSDSKNFPLLRAESLDATFANIIEADNGNWHFIDEEISTPSPLPIDFVIYKCIRFSLFRHGIGDRQAKKLIQSLYPSYNKMRHKHNQAFSAALQQEIFGYGVNPKLLRRSFLRTIIRNVIFRSLLELIWFKTPHKIRAFVRSRL